MKINHLADLYIDQLKVLYGAELHLLQALPKFSEAADYAAFKQLLSDQVDETKVHLLRLEELFEEVNQPPRGRCVAMYSLVAKGDEYVEAGIDPLLLDAALLWTLQSIAHYGISVYGSARYFAEMLNFQQSAVLLGQSLEEKQRIDTQLNVLAKEIINPRANFAHGDDQDPYIDMRPLERWRQDAARRLTEIRRGGKPRAH